MRASLPCGASRVGVRRVNIIEVGVGQPHHLEGGVAHLGLLDVVLRDGRDHDRVFFPLVE